MEVKCVSIDYFVLVLVVHIDCLYILTRAVLHIISVNKSNNELLWECFKKEMQPYISIVCNLDIRFVYICKFFSLNTITLGETTILKKWII